MATQLDITAQETSFDLVAPQHEELVDRFYRRLLTTAPATRALFAHADMRAQKRALLGALVALRRSLRDLSSITPFLADLGARHARYGVCAEHYPLAGAALLGGWAEVAGGVAAGIHHRVGPRLSGGRPDHDRRRRAVRRRGVTTTALPCCSAASMLGGRARFSRSPCSHGAKAGSIAHRGRLPPRVPSPTSTKEPGPARPKPPD